tara:strand:- start:2126 stop:2932 length:807 start_codon:yes stop_codon:yes gene_type:complete
MNEAKLARIRIYPIKGLDPVELNEVHVWKYSLLHDREFAMVAEDGTFVNGKSKFPVNLLKATYQLEEQKVTLSNRDGSNQQSFKLDENNQELIAYLSAFFKTNIRLIRSTQGELMDIPKLSSITVVSTKSIQSLQKDFPDHALEDLRLRFRTNLELSTLEAFDEEDLFDKPGKGVHFTIGDVEFIGISSRARCNVPPKDPMTGETDKSFVKKMMDSRKASLPENNLLLARGNYYQFTVDVFLPENQEGRIIRIGDEVKKIGVIDIKTN